MSSASATRSIGWRTVTPAAARCIAQPGLALATSPAAGTLDRRQLALADLPGQLRLQRRVGAAGAAAQAVVVELDDVGDGAEHGAHRRLGALHVAQVARILDDHRTQAALGLQPVDARGDELVHVRTRALNASASGVARRWP